MKKLLENLQKFGDVNTDVSFEKLTTLGIGGVARFVIYPNSIVSLEGLLNYLNAEHIPFKMIGKGSNLLCSDEPYEGVVIRLDKYFNDYYFCDEELVAQAGCSIIVMAQRAMERSLSGLEFASGIPATVGGTTYMNAGAYLSSMSEVIQSVLVYHDGKLDWFNKEECQFSYRHSIFQDHPNWVVVAVRIKLKHGNKEEIRDTMNSRRARRVNGQPLDKRSAGSTFKNPEGESAWKLIDGIGMRGYRIGGAKVSDKHANFLINEDHASAKDFMALVEKIQEEVKEKYGVELKMEVEKFNWR